MLKKTVEYIKNDKKRKEETKEFKLKTEEDFVKEVVEFKYTNVLLIDQLEIVYKENEILKEILKQVKDKKKNYVVKIQEITEKTENEKEQDMINKVCGRYVEILLGNSTETNIELVDILEEIDQTVNEYSKDNEDLKQKLWKAIQNLRDKDTKVNNIEKELELANDKIEDLQEKVHRINHELEEVQYKCKKE